MNEKKQHHGKGCLIVLRSWGLNKRAQSLVEFIALIMFILAAFLVFQKYIVRGMSGRWKGVGDALGQGKIYDPNLSVNCAYHPEISPGWYDRTCYEDNCRGLCGMPSNCGSCLVLNGCNSPICN